MENAKEKKLVILGEWKKHKKMEASWQSGTRKLFLHTKTPSDIALKGSPRVFPEPVGDCMEKTL